MRNGESRQEARQAAGTRVTEQGDGQPSVSRAIVPVRERGLGLVFAVLATVVWVGVGSSAQSGAEMRALSLFNLAVLGFLVLLAVGWRARGSDSFSGRWQWWLVGGVVVARVLGAAAASVGVPWGAALVSGIGLAAAAWLVTSAPSGRRFTWVQALEVALSLLFGILACVHGSRIAWVLVVAMATVRLLATAHRERSHLYLAVLAPLVVDAAFGTFDVQAMRSPDSSWHTVLPGLPLLAMAWAIAWGLPRRARGWWSLPYLARRVCRRIPVLMALAVASCGLLLWQSGSPTAVIAAAGAVVLCVAHVLLLKRQDRRFERAPRGPGETATRFRQVRAHLRSVLGEEGRSDSSCTVLMVDVDRFAAFNQRYGRDIGDHVLVRVGAVIQANLMRAGDQVARWHGDGFLVVLPNTPAIDAPIVARRLLAAVQGLGIGHVGTPSGVVTVSIGVASRPAWRRQRAGRLLRDADAALQRAKGDGRNRWDSEVLSSDDVPPGPTAIAEAA